MNEPTWWTYLKTVADTEDGRTIAEAAGVSPPQVSRWKTGANRPDADKLVRFARHFRNPPVAALVAAGYLTSDEAAEIIEINRDVESLTDEELIAELQRRMKGMRHALEAAQKSDASRSAPEGQEVSNGSERRTFAPLGSGKRARKGAGEHRA
ncbi:transcriptional repressor [Mycobacterium phage Yoshi]|uniref:HTH cro/C1-type domain-containing protein n=1 Tax=Mycobacterium phage Yoshi TaxID=2920891 RepID=G1BSG4_9CAUD|nr:transcriptional repressor [Mycobacterium phage Yoshi]AEK07864.1 hypothetical protein YOSHI_57 [Mycobacterium phage Yoshi]